MGVLSCGEVKRSEGQRHDLNYDDNGEPICTDPKGHEFVCTSTSYGGDGVVVGNPLYCYLEQEHSCPLCGGVKSLGAVTCRACYHSNRLRFGTLDEVKVKLDGAEIAARALSREHYRKRTGPQRSV